MMRMLTITMLAIGAALVVTAPQGTLAPSQTTRSTPGITFSNRLTPTKDGRVIRSTLVPKPTWRGGQSWIITIQHKGAPVESLAFRATPMRTYEYTDSIFAPFPTCTPYRVTVKPDTVLTATGRVSAKRDSLTAKLSLCRPLTAAEAAFADSFPSSGARVAICGVWMYKYDLDSLLAYRYRTATSAQDSVKARFDVAVARALPDSVAVPAASWHRGDTTRVLLGFEFHPAMFYKNRYTGRVAVVRNPTWEVTEPSIVGPTGPGVADVARCAPQRAAYEASPEGRSP